MAETYDDDVTLELSGLAAQFNAELAFAREIASRRGSDDLTAEQKAAKLVRLKAAHVCPTPSSCKIATYEGNPTP